MTQSPSIEVVVDATLATTVAAGDHITKGQPLGHDPDSGHTTTSPTNGTIESITFDANNHLFRIRIQTKHGQSHP